MRFKYINFYNDEEIINSVYDYIFTFCNRVKFRSSTDYYNIKNNDKKVDKNIYSYEIERKYDSEWGMQGLYITFKLSDFVKNILKKYTLEGSFFVEKNDDEKLFDNVTLLYNKKEFFSCCTHEGYTEFENEFKKKLDLYCYEKLKNTDTYKRMKQVYLNLKKTYTDDEICIMHDKLKYLHCYVDKACNAFIRQSSEYDDITWIEYLELAQKVFSKNICDQLEEASSFEQLQTLQSNNTEYLNSQFILSSLSYSIQRELSFLALFI
jgi:hypothetical protein